MAVKPFLVLAEFPRLIGGNSKAVKTKDIISAIGILVAVIIIILFYQA